MAQNKKDGRPVCPGTRTERAIKLVRTIAVVMLSGAGLYVALLAFAPLLVSTSAVRSAMERSLSAWTGEQASIGGTPQVRFWPEPRITLPNVTIVKPSASGDQVLGRIERLTASFGVIAALRGEPAFSDFEFVRPVISVTRDRDHHIVWTGGGLLGQAVARVRADAQAKPASEETLDTEIGNVTVEDGTVEFTDVSSGRNVTIDAISGEIKWANLSARFEGKVTASVAGRALTIDLSAAKPLVLFAGKDTAISLTLRAPGFGASFDGPANLYAGQLLSGALRLDIPDMAAFLTWGGWKQGPFVNVKRASVRAEVQTLGDSMRLDKFAATSDDSSASGVLDLMMPSGKRPKIGGTLAFDDIDLGALIDTFSALPPGFEKTPGLLPQWLDFDVTLSAATASLEPFKLEQMAASIVTSGTRRQVNIIDSRLEGGAFTAQLVDSGGPNGDQLQLSASDVDLAAIFERMPMQGPLPRGRGSLDLSLNFNKPMAVAGLDDVDGTLRFTASSGTLKPFNLDAILTRAASERFFRLSDTGTGSLDYDKIELAATLADGAARIDKGLLESSGSTLTLSGIVPYADNGLALMAQWTADPAKSQGASAQTTLFVGGSWPDPILSPMSR